MLVNKATLQNVFTGLKREFQQGLEMEQPKWDQVATLINSTTATEEYDWLGDWPQLREWIGDRVVKALEAHGYSIKNRKFESTIGVKRDHIEDDRLGIIGPRARNVGQLTAKHPDRLIFGLLKEGFNELAFDGQNFFDTDHPVGDGVVSNMQAGAGDPWFLLDTSQALRPLIFQRRRDYDFRALTDLTNEHVFMRDEFLFGVDARVAAGFGFWQMAFGSQGDLTEANFKAARTAMESFKNDEGEPLGVGPTHIVVGPSNRDAAEALFARQSNDAGAGNTLFQAVEIIVSRELA